uniref:Uncharacterized protein n=1 Tax=Chromera velia CCMP2878 TaxID=1169474 RepID=A0A0G4HI80_9ALVE|eukprot:Cvel_6950.t1-p1 / transcript=Cvel_6950.t1 / gene=Cvel_6950 / organism=Chromera_velia_CCMP2878 / gene_product=hypothetical protein / transcript_product=hypothetical protein / location=Cvel_scaffold352:60835-61614(-) / protein_length=260 / sequence_SO=supercontig / SO=protein_coding / is_pseudo=false
MKNGVLRIVSSVTKKVIEISKHQKQFLSPGAGGTTSSTSAKSLESLLDSTRTNGEPDFDQMHPEHAHHLANVSQNYRNHYNKWRSKQNERHSNKRTEREKQKGDFKGGSQGQPVRPKNKAQDVPSAPVSSQQLSLIDADMKRLATTILKIEQERQDSDEKKKTSERPKEERVRFATTTYDMETYEVMRRGDVDMVFSDSDGPSGIYDIYGYNPFSERNVFISESAPLLHQCRGGEENPGSTEEVEQTGKLTETKTESSAS